MVLAGFGWFGLVSVVNGTDLLTAGEDRQRAKKLLGPASGQLLFSPSKS